MKPVKIEVSHDNAKPWLSHPNCKSVKTLVDMVTSFSDFVVTNLAKDSESDAEVFWIKVTKLSPAPLVGHLPDAFDPFEREDQADEPTERMEIPMFNPATELDPNPDNPELVETH